MDQQQQETFSIPPGILEHIHDGVIFTDAEFRVTNWNQAAEHLYGWSSGEVVGKLASDVLQSKFNGHTIASIHQTLQEGGFVQVECTQTCRDGHTRVVESETGSIKDADGKITGYISLHHDRTDQRQQEESTRQALRRLEAQAEFTHLLANAQLDTQKILNLLARRASELIGDSCIVTTLAKDGETLQPVVISHPNPDAEALLTHTLARSPYRFGEGFAGNVAQTGNPLLIPQIAAGLAREMMKPEMHAYLDQFGVCSVMVVPLRIREQLIGTLGVTRDLGGQSYTSEDLIFLEALAGRAALWIANASLYEVLQKELAERQRMETELNEIQRRLLEGVEAERLELARDLHDGPIQELYSLTFQLQNLQEVIPNGENNETLAALQAGIQRIIDTLRTTSMELRPPSLTRFGLEAAIRSHAERFQKSRADLAISLDVQMDNRQVLSERGRLALFRIYQTALTNVARHAHAKQATIRLRADEQVVFLEIEDNGVGFHVPSRWVEMVRQGHLGLVGARERVEALGGNLQVLSRPGVGTTIRVQIPREA